MATPIYYIDVSKLGKDFIGTKDISLLTNEQAVLESVKNILATEPGERVMNPTFGCPLSQFIFEQIDPVTLVTLEYTITNSIREQEDRVDKLAINIQESPDENSIEILVKFNMKTSDKTQSLVLDLNKIR